MVVLGASPKPSRYSNQAVRLLMENGYRVTPIHPKIKHIEGLSVVPSLDVVTDQVHSLSLYIGPQRIQPMIDDIVTISPCRVIFNPGTESGDLQGRLDDAGIPWIEGCTLVMLRIGNF